MPAPYNLKNKDRHLHRHPAFFGTLSACVEDCCEVCYTLIKLQYWLTLPPSIALSASSYTEIHPFNYFFYSFQKHPKYSCVHLSLCHRRFCTKGAGGREQCTAHQMAPCWCSWGAIKWWYTAYRGEQDISQPLWIDLENEIEFIALLKTTLATSNPSPYRHCKVHW